MKERKKERERDREREIGRDRERGRERERDAYKEISEEKLRKIKITCVSICHFSSIDLAVILMMDHMILKSYIIYVQLKIYKFTLPFKSLKFQ